MAIRVSCSGRAGPKLVQTGSYDTKDEFSLDKSMEPPAMRKRRPKDSSLELTPPSRSKTDRRSFSPATKHISVF